MDGSGVWGLGPGDQHQDPFYDELAASESIRFPEGMTRQERYELVEVVGDALLRYLGAPRNLNAMARVAYVNATVDFSHRLTFELEKLGSEAKAMGDRPAFDVSDVRRAQRALEEIVETAAKVALQNQLTQQVREQVEEEQQEATARTRQGHQRRLAAANILSTLSTLTAGVSAPFVTTTLGKVGLGVSLVAQSGAWLLTWPWRRA